MRARFLFLAATGLLAGCAAPVGNLIALEGEGVHAGARLTAGFPVKPEVRSAPAFAAPEIAWVGRYAYVRGEAPLLPPVPWFAGGSLGCGLHWRDRAALGGHVIMASGAGTGFDLAVRPLGHHPWVTTASWTPAIRRSGDDYSLPVTGQGHDWQFSLGWTPVPDSEAGVIAVELGTQRTGSTGDWSAFVRVSGSTRIFPHWSRTPPWRDSAATWGRLPH